MSFIHTEIRGAVFDEHIKFFKAVRVQQKFQPFARGEFTFGMLAVDTPLPAAHTRIRAPLRQLVYNIAHKVPRKLGLKYRRHPNKAGMIIKPDLYEIYDIHLMNTLGHQGH